MYCISVSIGIWFLKGYNAPVGGSIQRNRGQLSGLMVKKKIEYIREKSDKRDSGEIGWGMGLIKTCSIPI